LQLLTEPLRLRLGFQIISQCRPHGWQTAAQGGASSQHLVVVTFTIRPPSHIEAGSLCHWLIMKYNTKMDKNISEQRHSNGNNKILYWKFPYTLKQCQ
jgi:hypothetical protein